LPIRSTMSGFKTPEADSPRNTSAPSITSPSVRLSVSCANTAFPLVHQGFAALVDHAVDVGQPDVLRLHAHGADQVEAGKRCRACAGGDNLDVLKLLAGNFHAVDNGRRHDDCRAMLVVMEHGMFIFCFRRLR
jgi:hypothetical protein